VTDRGPCRPSGQWRRGASRSGSTGLGPDIVHRIATTSGGQISIGAAPGGGAQVTVVSARLRKHPSAAAWLAAIGMLDRDAPASGVRRWAL